MRNRSTSKPGHRAGRKPRARGSNARRSVITTNVIDVALNAASSAVVDITFDRPVTAGDPASPGTTDANMVSSNGGTTRYGISTTQTRPNFVSVTCSAPLTRAKNYTATLIDNQGLIQPVAGKFGRKAKTFTT